MTYKQIEASREARLWIGQVLIPAGLIVATGLTNPEVRKAAAAKADEMKKTIKNKFKKKESKDTNTETKGTYPWGSK